MNVFELVVPGTWVAMDNHELAWKIEGYVDMIHSNFAEAAMVLELFIQARSAERERFAACAGGRTSASQDPDMDPALLELTKKMCESPEDSLKHHQEWHARQISLRRQKWASGEVPLEYSRTLTRFYARGFLYSVWTIGRMFDRIAQCEGAPEACAQIAAQFWAGLPGLRGMRDSSAHVDERIDGMARGKKIVAQPIDNSFVKAPGGSIMFIENLVNDTFTGTTADGNMAEIDVSAGTMSVVQQYVQAMISAFGWRGVGRVCPEC